MAVFEPEFDLWKHGFLQWGGPAKRLEWPNITQFVSCPPILQYSTGNGTRSIMHAEEFVLVDDPGITSTHDLPPTLSLPTIQTTGGWWHMMMGWWGCATSPIKGWQIWIPHQGKAWSADDFSGVRLMNELIRINKMSAEDHVTWIYELADNAQCIPLLKMLRVSPIWWHLVWMLGYCHLFSIGWSHIKFFNIIRFYMAVSTFAMTCS